MMKRALAVALLSLVATVDVGASPLHDALLAMANGETNDAIAQLDRIAARGSTDAPSALLLKARAQFLAGRYDASAQSYQRLLTQVAPTSPAGIKAQFGLAECDAVAGRFREAEQRFSTALAQLTSPARRDELVRRFIKLGDEQLTPSAVRASPDPARAEKIFRAAFDLGADGALRDEVALKIGRSMARQKRHAEAARFLEEYVAKTPDITRKADFWYRAGRYEIRSGNMADARRLLRDLVADFPLSPLSPRASFWISRSFGMPKPKDGQALARGTAALEEFVRRFPKDRRVERARLEVALAAMQLGRHGQAEQALRAYIAAGGPEENVARARFALGECLAKQGRWHEATQSWLDYLKHHASHGSWLQAQQGIEEMAFAEADAALQKKQWAGAAALFRQYAEKYPAAARAPRALLAAGLAEAEQRRTPQALELLRALTTKFPQTAEAADGWCEIGRLSEERDRDVAQARTAYRKALAIVANHPRASSRLADLEQPSLVVDRPRTVRVGEKPVLTWYTRNIEQVSVRIYRVDAADFFRDHHSLEQLTALDIALCAPDRSLTVPVAGYQRSVRITQKVPLPIAEAGLYLVSLGGENLEVTTPLLVSDLGLVLKAAPRQTLLFAQDLRQLKPLAGVHILLSDDEKSLGEGTTNGEGVLLLELPERDSGSSLRAVAERNGQVAWASVDSGNGQPLSAATPRAFLFTDRPVYQPGDTVHVAGIVRDRVDARGVNGFDPAARYGLTVRNGDWTVQQSTVGLDAFGVLHTTVALDPLAPAGTYNFTLQRAKSPHAFDGSFRVEAHRLAPFQLEVTFDRPVVLRGEPIVGSIRVRHRSGAPASDQTVVYHIDDGSLPRIGTTDRSGAVRFSFSSQGLEETRPVKLDVELRAHHVVHSASALVAVQAFEIALSVDRTTLYAGQPFDAAVLVRDPERKPAAAAIELELVERLTAGGERRVKQLSVAVPAAGRARVALTAPTGGSYWLRAFGRDANGQPIASELPLRAIGAEEPGIFLDVDRPVQTLGSTAQVRLESRLDRALALITYETDRVLQVSSIPIHKGSNTLSVPIDAALAPNFDLSACAMAGDQLYVATRSIEVAQRLQISIRADRDRYAPGDEVRLTVEARDAREQPVDARVILSVVDEALLVAFPEVLPDLLETFVQRRPTDLIATAASNGYVDEQLTAVEVVPAEVVETEGSAAMAALSERRRELTEKAAERFGELAKIDMKMGVGGGEAGYGSGMGGLGTRGYGAGGGGSSTMVMGQAITRGAVLRRFFAETAAFFPDLRTGPTGVATVTFRLPDAITSWRVAARSVTRDTQLGEAKRTLVATRSFWAELVVPAELDEGDLLRPLVRLFNDSDRPLTVATTLQFGSRRDSQRGQVAARGSQELTFAAIEVPPAGSPKLSLELVADAGTTADRVREEIAIRPRGMADEIAVAGRLEGTAVRTLLLDAGLAAPQLSIQLDARLTHLFLATPRDPLIDVSSADDALIALNVLDLLGPRAHPAMLEQVRSEARRSLGRVVALEHGDGSWGRSAGSHQEIVATAAAVRALARGRNQAAALGWIFPAAVFDRALAKLKGELPTLAIDDWDTRTEILYALAHAGRDQAPQVELHRLHRLRAELPLSAQAQLGLTWQLLGRAENAAEVARTLRSRLDAEGKRGRHPTWGGWSMDTAVLADALQLLALVSPNDALVRTGAELLLDFGAAGLDDARTAGAVTGALSRLLGAAKRDERFRVHARVNGKDAGSAFVVGGNQGGQWEIAVDPKLLVVGDNKLELIVEGGGSCFYVAKLRGYRQQPPAPATDSPLSLQRVVEAVPAPYRGQDIRSGFSVAADGTKVWREPIDRVPAGQRIRVALEVHKSMDDPLPDLLLEDRIPAGFELVEGSVVGAVGHRASPGRRLVFFVDLASRDTRIEYQLAARNPGRYRFTAARLAAPGVPELRVFGGLRDFVVDESTAPLPKVRPTPDELYQRGLAAASAKDAALAIEQLEPLFEQFRLKPEIGREALSTLLFAAIDVADAKRTVKYFELAKEKNPDLVVPFDKLAPVQLAYRQMQEFESGLHVARGSAHARLLAAMRSVGVLEVEDQVVAARQLFDELIGAYPDSDLAAEASYSFGQVLFNRADRVGEANDLPGLDRGQLLDDVVALLVQYVGRYPQAPQAPSAIYSLATALIERKLVPAAVAWCDAGLSRHGDSDMAPALTYLKAYGHFKLLQYDRSLELCQKVARNDEDEESAAMAKYIMAQIYHAQGKLDRALELYRQVADQYRDAAEAIDDATVARLEIPEVVAVPVGQRPRLAALTKNLKRIELRAYRVDLMKLYLLKGNLDSIAEINLAGVRPAAVRDIDLDSKTRGTTARDLEMDLPGAGAYLVRIRGGSELRHSLLLVDSLQLDVHEDQAEQRVRVTVRDAHGRPAVGARVQLRGEADARFIAGETDLRGVFIASQIEGPATVIAQYQGAYGLHRTAVGGLIGSEIGDSGAAENQAAKAAGDEAEQRGAYESVEDQLAKPERNEQARGFFQQDVKGMAVEQAK